MSVNIGSKAPEHIRSVDLIYILGLCEMYRVKGGHRNEVLGAPFWTWGHIYTYMLLLI